MLRVIPSEEPPVVPQENKTIFWCGNGGSASQANHLSAELIGGMYKDKNPPFKSVCLNVDTAFITAWSNDDSFDNIFARQLESLAKSGDILIALSIATQHKSFENVKCWSSFLNSQIPLSGNFQLLATTQTIDFTIDHSSSKFFLKIKKINKK